jgi:hypothetical protein
MLCVDRSIDVENGIARRKRFRKATEGKVNFLRNRQGFDMTGRRIRARDEALIYTYGDREAALASS